LEKSEYQYLPPVRVVLVDDLQDISLVKLQTGLLAGDQVIVPRIVVKVRLHEYLARRSLLSIGGYYLEVYVTFLICEVVG
jgi:hypothetical protein